MSRIVLWVLASALMAAAGCAGERLCFRGRGRAVWVEQGKGNGG